MLRRTRRPAPPSAAPRRAGRSLRAAVACALALPAALPAQEPAVLPDLEAVIVPERAAGFGAGVVAAARRHLGVPYRLGGETPRAFDCSGFVRWVFAERGVALPRTAREQAGVGDAPYPGDLAPGDLLFFWGGAGAQHVAIYAGGDSIVHASARGGQVRVDRMRGAGAQRDWFGRRLIAVRRIRPATPAATAATATPRGRSAPATGATIFAGGTR